MTKACIIGGSNGIGLAIAKRLIELGYYVIICDLIAPEKNEFIENKYEFHETNLLDFDEQLFRTISSDNELKVLMITAGFGRVSAFEYLHIGEIQNILTVNTVSSIKLLSIFYHRIKDKNAFYTGIMGSIAGIVNSPLFSVYAASKAAICRLVESVNVELEMMGTSNRILNVSPGSIKGTKFNGGENDFSQTCTLAKEIIDKLFNSNLLFIPDYEQTFKNVIARYNLNSNEFGKSSYEYKMKSGRIQNEKKARIGYLSGTFDLFHVGHLRLLERAKEQCDYLIVGVHPDASHKGKTVFIPFEERKAIVASIKYVDKVIDSMPEDCDVWENEHYTKLFVGSDYKGTERFNRYEKFFKNKNVEIVYFPYTQGTSSSIIREKILKSK